MSNQSPQHNPETGEIMDAHFEEVPPAQESISAKAQAAMTPPATTIDGFAKFLDQIHGGHFGDKCQAALVELVAAIEEVRKPGELTITLKLKPDPEVQGMKVFPEISTKLPKHPPRPSFFHVTPENKLIRDHPQQPMLIPRKYGE